MSPGARVSLTMTAVRQTVTIVTVVDGVVRLVIGATTGTCHGTVPVRVVVPTRGPEPGERRSHGQRMQGTTRVQDDHEKLVQAGEASGTLQQGHLPRPSAARSCTALYAQWDPGSVLQSGRDHTTCGAAWPRAWEAGKPERVEGRRLLWRLGREETLQMCRRLVRRNHGYRRSVTSRIPQAAH